MSDMLIDVTRLLGRFLKERLPTGVDRVSLAYVEHFADRAHAMVRLGGPVMVLPRAASRKVFGSLTSASPERDRSLLWTIVQESLKIGSSRDLKGAHLFNTGHSGLEQPHYAARLRRSGARPVFFVHDLIPISYPEYCRRGERDKHLIRMRNVLELACGVITNSMATLNELGHFAKRSGQPMPPSVVAPLAPTSLPSPSPVRPFAAPYFVMLGTIEPRKNHWLLLHLWRKLIEQQGEGAPRLVVIGQRGWECENVVDLLERCETLRGFVTELRACSDADLSTYLHHAQALLFPSFAEGYGIPLVEALSLGVPVIASDLPVFREIAGDIPEYLDPLDGKAWLARVLAYSDPACPVRAEQLKRIAGFVPPSWPAHFQVVESFLERLP